MKTRTSPLQAIHQQEIVRRAIPARIEVIQRFLRAPNPSYALTTAAAVFSRAIASFLGVRVKKGVLARDSEHFEHATGASWEVKIVDIDRGEYVNLDALTRVQKRALEAGLVEVNTAFAHVTFWESPSNQTPAGGPTSVYVLEQQKRIRDLALLVIELFNEAIRKTKA